MPRSEHPVFCYVYVLQSEKNHKFYTGVTEDLRKRVAEHNSKLNRSTKAFLPWKLIFYEAYISRADARRREKYLKTTQGSRVIHSMLRDYLGSQA